VKDGPPSEAETRRELASELSPPSKRGAPPDELIGQVLLGRYRIDELIAEGGMGSVYLGEHIHMHKRVAIKVLHPEIDNYTETVARFEREAMAGAHISHPNVVVATDFDELPDGTCFLILEYVRGVTLHELLRRSGPLPPARAVHIAKQIAAALGAAHEMGILHRDVKPRNVMLVEQGPRPGSLSGETSTDRRQGRREVVKLIDFGLCKVPLERISTTGAETRRAGALTGKGVVFGTPPYMAPETALGMDSVDERADLYALGIVLYRMLSGKHPFDATTETEHLLANRLQPPPPIKVRSPGVDVPRELEEVVMRLLKKDLRARYDSAAALIEALDAALPADADAEWIPWTTPLPMSIAGAPSVPPPPESDGDADLPTSPADTRSSEPPTAPSIPRAERPPIASAPALQVVATPARWKTVAAALAVVGVGALIGLLAAGTAPTKHETTPSPSASAPPPPEQTAAPSASVPPPLDIDGKDAAAWRAELLRSAMAKDIRQGAAPLLALADLDPEGFADAPVATAAADIAVRLASAADERADRVFEVLGTRVGPSGLDVLYSIVRGRGGSKGADRATELLHRPDVLEQASPALRVALALRDAACADKPSLFERAADVGDDRALEQMDALRASDCQPRLGQCCFHGLPALEVATQRLRRRVRPPASDR